MRGNGNLVGSGGHCESAMSLYQQTFRGLTTKVPAKPLDLDWTASCSVGVVVPDPTMIKTNKAKMASYRTDLRRV